MKQMTLATAGFERYGKTTRRAVFLSEMDKVVPWSALCRKVAPYYPKPGNGRPAIGIERMLSIYWPSTAGFQLNNPGFDIASNHCRVSRGA